MIQRAIVAFVDTPSASAIHALRRRYDPLAGALGPHITLVFPYASELTVDEIEAHMRRSLASTPKFSIELRGVTGSEDAYLFLNVKRGNDQIIALHDRLYSGPLQPYLSPRHTYVPHMTIGRLSTSDAFEVALAAARAVEVRLTTEVHEVTLYRLGDDGDRGIERRVSLAPSRKISG